MTLPTNLASKVKTIPMDPASLAVHPELAYLTSFSQQRILYIIKHLYISRSIRTQDNLIIHHYKHINTLISIRILIRLSLQRIVRSILRKVNSFLKE